MSSGHRKIITINHEQLPNNRDAGYNNAALTPRNDEFDEIDIRSIFDVLLRRKLIILGIALLFAGITLLSSLSQIPVYRAETSVKIDLDTEKLTHFDTGVEDNTTPGLLLFNVQLQILKSRQLAERVTAQLAKSTSTKTAKTSTPPKVNPISKLLNTVHSQFNDLIRETRSKLTAGVSDKMAEKAGNGKSKLSGFINNISIDTNRHSKNGHTIVSIQYDSIDPELAAKSANLIAKEFIQLDLEKKLTKNAKTKSYLEEQLLLTKNRLLASENKLITYSKEKEVFHDGKSQSLTANSLVELNKAYIEARNTLINAKSEYLQEQEHPINGTLITNSTLEALQQRKGILESQYQKDLQTFKPSFPAMRELDRQIKELTQQISKQRQLLNASNMASLKNRYLAAKEKEALLAKELQDKKTALIHEKKQTIGYGALHRDVETNRLMYEQLLKYLKEVSIAQGITYSNISVIDEAIVPFAPISPNVMREFLIGTLMGFFLGLMAAFLREYFDDKIRTSEDLENLSILPVLGVIPFTKKNKAALPADLGSEHSIGAEAFHSLVSNLDYVSEEGIPRILHITSSRPGEGKSSTALQLAKTLADSEDNKKILLIDADLRKPSLGRYLGTEHPNTLSDFLRGKANMDDILLNSKVPNLSLISDKGAPCNPAKLLAGDRLIELLDQATQKFDHVIIDSPPVLGLADALILANRSIATLFVVSSCETRKKYFKDSIKRIKLSCGNLNGFVLTKSKTLNASYYGMDYYYGTPQQQRFIAQNPAESVSRKSIQGI